MQIIHITAGAAMLFGAAAAPALAQQSSAPSSTQAMPSAQGAQGAQPPTATGKTADPRRPNSGTADNNNTQDHMDAEARGNGQAPTGADANTPARGAQSPSR